MDCRALYQYESVYTFCSVTLAALAGAGDAGFWVSLTVEPSGPFTDTLGISGLAGDAALAGTGVPVPDAGTVVTAFRAPGGTYALALLTTAPYLKTTVKFACYSVK